MKLLPVAYSFLATLLTSFPAAAQTDYHEIEPNESKTEATIADCLLSGDLVSGWPSTYPPEDDRDVFRVRICPRPPGIYQHRLDLDHFTFIPDYFPEIRGRSQAAGQIDTDSDVVLQRAIGAEPRDRFVQWYGFGKGEEIYYDVGETTSFRTGHDSYLETTPVTPAVVAGTFDPGTITISSLGLGHASNTEIWVYDEEYNAIPGYGNDDEIVLLQEQAELVRTYAAGTYYIAISDAGLANDLASPSDDDFREGSVLDFPDAILNGSTNVGVDVTFLVTDGTNTTVVPAMKNGIFDVLWFEIHVGTGDEFQPYCFGDGTGTQCPCSNTSTPGTGQGCANTTGRGGLLIGSGTASIAADDLVLTARNLTESQFALLFVSTSGSPMQVPAMAVGDGLRCIGQPSTRLGLRPTGGMGMSSWTGFAGTNGFFVGYLATFQVAYRDPVGSPCGSGFNFTNAVGVTLAP
ncbi:MAG: hypothetical protein GY711_08745 [bacterium]|nr:hypothetical protein [bacterium]